MIGPSKMEWAVEEASKAFWVELTKQLPEITTNEIDTGTVIVLQLHMKNAAEQWVQTNLTAMEVAHESGRP